MDDVFQYIDEHSSLYIDRLLHLLRKETLAIQRKGIAEGAEYVVGLLEDIGAVPKLIPLGETTYVVTHLDGSHNHTIGFYNHFDTQPPERLEAWNSPPFDPIVHDGILYGRGATDNKGNLVARICAIEAYKNVRGHLPINVIFLHDGEEEIGSPNMPTFLDQYGELVDKADGWVWEGGDKNSDEQLEIYLGVNGMLGIELEVVTSQEDLHGSRSAIVPNAAWKLIWALNSLKDSSERILVENFYEQVNPPDPDEMAILNSLPIDPVSIKRKYQITEFAGGQSLAKALERQYLYPYLNISGMVSGYQGDGMKCILPHSAKCKLEFFLAPDQDPEKVFSHVSNHFKDHGFDDIVLNPYTTMPPSRTKPTAGFAQLAMELANEIYENGTVVYPIMPGFNPMGLFTKRFGVPAISLGVGNANSRIHQPNENVRVEDFLLGIKFIAALLERLGQSPQSWK
ncbi:MAG: hypothetical protein A2029_04415 [Chloroflexi bacterium RBG_19FT_COMBO_47_9]|nr:MAG: hypothetical protein A2029_04415 [Chloroflexi bacterium RBG_19FT_COMBO_47_9]